MRDVLLAEVTLKIKKTWHINWQFCETWWLFFILLFLSVPINLNCSISLFVSLWLCLR